MSPVRLRSGVMVFALLWTAVACTPPTSPPGPVTWPTDVAERFVDVRPSVGPTLVVSPAGLDLGGRQLLASLQGLVNRSSARLFVRAQPADDFWVGHYRDSGLVDVVGSTDLAGALDRFAGEATGYVLVSETEPWTINAGMTVASLRNALVVTEAHRAEVERRGLSMIEDLRGRWPDGPTAYESVFDEYASTLSHTGVAVLRPTDLNHDFAYQQRFAVVYGRPTEPGWDRILTLIRRAPRSRAVYGWIADVPVDEPLAVTQLSSWGQVLIASDTTSNLSYHVAVGADRPRVVVPHRDRSAVAPCSTGTVNVIVAITDGDNLALPTSRYVASPFWRAPGRGSLPLGWSINPSLAYLAPAVWDYYAATATANDELVPVVGYGYVAASALPDPADFYRTSFGLGRELGMTSYWSFFSGADWGSSDQYPLIDAAAGAGDPNSVLVGYYQYVGGEVGATPAGRPVFNAIGSGYTDTPAQIADKIRALTTLAPSLRQPVYFLSASAWTTDAQGLVEQLAPLATQGVRFLTPTDAAACRTNTP